MIRLFGVALVIAAMALLYWSGFEYENWAEALGITTFADPTMMLLPIFCAVFGLAAFGIAITFFGWTFFDNDYDPPVMWGRIRMD